METTDGMNEQEVVRAEGARATRVVKYPTPESLRGTLAAITRSQDFLGMTRKPKTFPEVLQRVLDDYDEPIARLMAVYPGVWAELVSEYFIAARSEWVEALTAADDEAIRLALAQRDSAHVGMLVELAWYRYAVPRITKLYETLYEERQIRRAEDRADIPGYEEE